MIRTLNLWLFVALSALVPGFAPAADLSLKVEEKVPPQELPAEIKSALQGKSIRLTDGDKAVFEFWFRTEVPLSSTPAEPSKSLDSLKQAVLLGAVRIGSDMRDYRDDEVGAGVYTIRFGLQPSDGNHLGTAAFSYFAVLIPVKYETKVDGITDYKAMVKASSKDTSTGHPLILSLRPVTEMGSGLPVLKEPAPSHKSVRLILPGNAGEAKSQVVFDLVYEGKAKE
jgi:hypothetical protein